jgi:hypothetical protein
MLEKVFTALATSSSKFQLATNSIIGKPSINKIES